MLRCSISASAAARTAAAAAATSGTSVRCCRLASTATAHAAPRRRRWMRRVAVSTLGTAAVVAAASAVSLPPRVDVPLEPSSPARSSSKGIDSAVDTLQLSALLATALHYAATRERILSQHDSDASSSSSSSDTTALELPEVVRDAIAIAMQMTQLLRNPSSSSSSRNDIQSRIVELLADAVLDASLSHKDSAGDALLRKLTQRGLVNALLRYVAHAKPTDESLVQKIVQAIETLVAAANVSDDDATSALGISLETLGAALGHLVDAQALRFTDLLRIGELLCHAQQRQSARSELPHFRVARPSVFISALRSGDRHSHDDSSTSAFANGLDGFFRLLSPEMPSSIKQFSLYALTSMLERVEQLPRAQQTHLVDKFLSPTCAALVLALPRSNEALQRHAAAFLNVLMHLAPQHAPLTTHAVYELWLTQLRHWTTASPALQLASAQCLRTLSTYPQSRRVLTESPATMAALYDLARRLHESVARASAPVSHAVRPTKKKTLRAKTPLPLVLDLQDAVAMQRHVSRAVRNVCVSVQDGSAALTASSASLLLHSKRTLPMSQVFRRTLDLSDLPVVGAEEYESSTDVGWIDILTAWTASSQRDVRLNAIATLVHLAERPDAQALATATDQLLQAWLTSMLQHVRTLSGGGEILAVKQVETIAKLSDGLTPGNEAVAFNPAVVDTGTAALAVLVENHHEELIAQGVVPLIALLSQSQHATASESDEAFDLKTQCARVLANLVATSCRELDAFVHSHSHGHSRPSDDVLGRQALGRQDAWKRFVADHVNVERQLQETPSGKQLRHELSRYSQWTDPMRRSSYYRAVQNMAAYRAFLATGRLDQDVYAEGVHPIVPYADPTDESGASAVLETQTQTPVVDVVFVHGLRGHPFGTWRTDMSSALDASNDIWPDVLLAPDLAQRGVAARLVTLGYEANMVSWSSPWPTLTLQERGKVMLDALYAANIGRSTRPDEPPRPVIFVTHSMGGILVKKMLLLAQEQAQQQQRTRDNLAASTRGVVFLAVPHFGSDLAKGVRSEAVRSLIQAHPAIQDLCADHDGRLEDLNAAFHALGIDCMSIGEAKPAPLALGLSAIVVKPESADPGFGAFHVLADSDHMTICKAKRLDEPHYCAIRDFVLAHAPAATTASSASADETSEETETEASETCESVVTPQASTV